MDGELKPVPVEEKKLKTLSLDLIDTIVELRRNPVASEQEFKAALTVIMLPTLAKVRGEGVEIGYSTALKDVREISAVEGTDLKRVEEYLVALMKEYNIRMVR